MSFGYPGQEGEAIKNLSFVIKPGETVAIVGRNGAGKTTLIKLLCRLYDPIEGRILLDGIDIREFDPDELRAQVGAMFQDYVTYQATARENIGLGSLPDQEDEHAVAVGATRRRWAQRGGAEELIRRMPHEWETMLGKWFDEGVNLSGGEWQKVALSSQRPNGHVSWAKERTRTLLLGSRGRWALWVSSPLLRQTASEPKTRMRIFLGWDGSGHRSAP